MAGHPLEIDQYFNGSPTPGGRHVSFTWNGPNGLPDTMTAHGVTTTMSFDATGNVNQTLDSIGRQTATPRDAYGNVSAYFDGATTTTFAYDANNRLTTITDANSNATTIGYTLSGCGCTESSLVSSVHTPDLAAALHWAFTYGAEERLATATDPDGHAASFQYEPTGELKLVTDQNDNTTIVTHDQLGRVATIVDSLGRTHGRSYPYPTSTGWSGPNVMTGSASANAASASLTANLNVGDYQVGSNVFDAYPDSAGTRSRGWAQVELYQDATTQVSYGLAWDDAHRITYREDRAGTAFAGNVVSSGGSTGLYAADSISWIPDLPAALPTHEVSFVSSGQQSSGLAYSTEFDETGSFGFGQGTGAGYGYTRDTAGRLTQTTSQYCFDAGCPAGPTQTYVYEATNNRLSTLTDADGEHDVVYDSRGFVHTITVTHGGTLEGTYTFGYDASGRNTSLQYPDGHQRIQQYDNEGRITSRCYQYTNAALDRCYTAVFDPAGNPTTMTDPGGTDVITYDPLYRVTSVTRQVSGQPDVVETYTYNALGALNANAASVTGFTLNDQRPLLSGAGTGDSAIMAAVNGTSVSVDPAGHVTSLLGATITVDRQERVVGIASGGTTLGYAYDSHHRRVLRSVNGVDEYYQYEGVNLVGRLDATGAVEDTWLYDGVDDPLRLQRGGFTYYYELDLAGNVRRLRDATGADLGGYRYSAFGVTLPADAATPASSVDQMLRWKGRPFENAAGGLYDMRARWWSPGAGQFLTVDRLEYFDATSTLWGWGGQSPLRWGDPSGHCGGACVGAAIGFLGGAIYGAATADTSNFGDYAANVASYAAAGAVGGFIGGAGGGFAGTLLGGGTAAEGLAGAFGVAAGGWIANAVGAAGPACAVRAASAIAAVGTPVTRAGLDAVKQHLSQFESYAPNDAMLERLANAVGTNATAADEAFYTHELAEADFMAQGLDQGAAHQAALDLYNASPFSLYAPEVVKAFPEYFNSNWRAFWGL